MQQPSSQEIQKKFTTLSDKLRQVITAVQTAETLQNISEKNNLNTNQTKELGKHCGLVMLGFEPPINFIGNVKSGLNISEEKAGEIAKDINTRIFRQVKEELQKLYRITDTSKTPPPPITPLPNLPAKPPAPVVPKPPIPPPPTTDLQPTTYNQQPKLAEKEKTPLERTTPGGHYENGENHLNREEILAGIENPAPARPARIASVASSASIASKPGTGNIVQDKLEGMVRMPKEETDLSKEYSADPYREPLG